jgi:hypothetical protein
LRFTHLSQHRFLNDGRGRFAGFLLSGPDQSVHLRMRRNIRGLSFLSGFRLIIVCTVKTNVKTCKKKNDCPSLGCIYSQRKKPVFTLVLTTLRKMKKKQSNYRIRADVLALLSETSTLSGMTMVDIIEQCVLAQARTITKETCPDLAYLKNRRKSSEDLSRTLKNKQLNVRDQKTPDSN